MLREFNEVVDLAYSFDSTRVVDQVLATSINATAAGGRIARALSHSSATCRGQFAQRKAPIAKTTGLSVVGRRRGSLRAVLMQDSTTGRR